MPTQQDYQKVNRCIIDPIKALYRVEFNEYMVEAMVEDLCVFDEQRLTEAMREIRRTRQSRPSIAHILEACKNQAANSPPTLEYGATPKGGFSLIANKALRTDRAKEAKRQGWLNEFHLFVSEKGRFPDPEEEANLIHNWRGSPTDDELVTMVATLDEKNFMKKPLEKALDAFLKRKMKLAAGVW